MLLDERILSKLTFRSREIVSGQAQIKHLFCLRIRHNSIEASVPIDCLSDSSSSPGSLGDSWNG